MRPLVADAGEDEAPFVMMVGIFHAAGEVIVEDFDGIGEVDPVFAKVVLALVFIPFEVGVHGNHCMHICRPSQNFFAADGPKEGALAH